MTTPYSAPIALTGLALATAMATSADTLAATRMLERFNVGGFIRVPGSASYRLGAHPRPRALPRATAALRASPGNRAVRSAAESYLARFPHTTGLLLLDRGRILFVAYRGQGGPR